MRFAVLGASCGTVVDPVSFQGLVEVSIDSCPGDSGGGWYHIGTNSARIAWGIQSRSDDGNECHGAGEHSFFSALPDINTFWDDNSAATIRVETR
jgi:streptogrisin C